MQTVYSPEHTLHDPPSDFFEGNLVPYEEMPRRAEIIREAILAANLGPVIAPRDYGLEPIRAVHTDDYLEHFRTIHDDWTAAGGSPISVLPAVFPRPGFDRPSPSPFARAAQYTFDLSAPVTRTTYDAALASAYCALTAADLVADGGSGGEAFAYALCRPPGHHAYAGLMGGFCFLNNAAIAAQALASRGARVAILDIDVHHGNGTQAIFYDRADVLFVSIHGSPEWEYPYFAGFADERGTGQGEGYTLNLPVARGTGDDEYLSVCDVALKSIQSFAPDFLVVSAGFDTFGGDPLSKLQITTLGFGRIGARIASLKLPTVVVQEGGYAVEQLGLNVVSFLQGLAG